MILDVATTLISPDNVIIPVELIAPALLIPVPEILISSAMVNPVAIVNWAPDEMVVVPAVVPRAFVLEIEIVPADIVVSPV